MSDGPTAEERRREDAERDLKEARMLLSQVLQGFDILTDRSWVRKCKRLLGET
jgi:hypothetical protein